MLCRKTALSSLGDLSYQLFGPKRYKKDHPVRFDDDDNDDDDAFYNKSAQSNLGRGPRRGGLQPACVAVRRGYCAVAFIHEYACYAGNFAA